MAPPSAQHLFMCPICAEEGVTFDACTQSNGSSHLMAVHPLELFPSHMLGWHDPIVFEQYRAFMNGRIRTPPPIFILGVHWKYLELMMPGAAHEKGYEIRPASFCEQLADNLPVIIGFSCLAKQTRGLSDKFKGKIVMLATVIECTDNLEGVTAEYLGQKKETQMKLVLGGRLVLEPPVSFLHERGQAIGAKCAYSLHPAAQKAVRAAVRKLIQPFASVLAAEVVRERSTLGPLCAAREHLP